jgi:hypothetical protein
VRVVFVRPEVIGNDGPQSVEYAYGQRDAAAIEEELLAEHQRMSEGEYDALAEKDFLGCGDCAAADTVCPHGPSGQSSQR